MSETEKIEMVVDAKANNENEQANGGDGATCQNSHVDNGNAKAPEDSNSSSNCTQTTGNLEKASTQEDVSLRAVGTSLELEPPKANGDRAPKIEPHGWNRTKCCLLVFFIILFVLWAAVYYAYAQGYLDKLIKLIK